MSKYEYDDIFNFNKCIWENKFILVKKNEYDTLKIKFSKKLIKLEDKSYKDKLKKSIKNFLIVMSSSCKNFDPTIFLTNAKKTFFEINTLKEGDVIKGRVITYSTNKLSINDFTAINHEFLHLASLGKFIPGEIVPYTEGYTQLLTERYFKEGILKAYILETDIMRKIELIIGKDLMETSFFQGNLNNTINELYKYESTENINDLLNNFRILHNHRKPSDKNSVDMIQKLFYDINNILFLCLKNKINDMDDLDEIYDVLNEGLWTNIHTYKDRNYDDYITITALKIEDFEELLHDVHLRFKNTKRI